jgi:hypothetical protein
MPGILSSSPARRFRVLASFSLRSDAHVATNAPLRCLRKPRQNAELGGRSVLERLGMAPPVPGILIWAWEPTPIASEDRE